MGILEYIYIVIGLILVSAFGRLITTKNFASSLLAGVLLIGSIVAVTSRFIPLYNVLIISVLVSIGFLIFLFRLSKEELKQMLILRKDKIPVVALIFGIVSVYFVIFHYNLFLFEDHTALYFSPSFEMLKADYAGNLRIPCLYPLELSSMHLLPSAVVAVIGFLNPNPNLAYFTEIRYVLIIIFFTNFIYFLYKKLGASHWKFLFVLFIVFGIYQAEIRYNLIIGSR